MTTRLREAIELVLARQVDFNEKKQEFFCRACRYRDPIGERLHHPSCSIYELHAAYEEAMRGKQEQAS